MKIEFSDCVLNTDSRELTRGCELISIEPKTLELLIYLINNRDRAIDKDELQDSVWGTIVTDAAMTRAVMKLRKAVGDTTDDASIIKTIRRFGYRFVASVKEGDLGTPAAEPVRPGIAVLPLENMSGDPENNYFGDGIAEEILKLRPGDTRASGLGACDLRKIGDCESGVGWLDKSLQLAPDDIPVLHMAGCFCGAEGEVDKALDYLERRFELGDAYMDWLESDSDFDSLRDHPRFKAMVNKSRNRSWVR